MSTTPASPTVPPRANSGARLTRYPRAAAAVTRAAAAGGERAARVDDRPGTRRAALRALPQVLARRFVPAAATGLSTVYELRVLASGGGDEARFALLIRDGELTVEPRAAPEATAWVSVGLGDMIRLVTGSVGVWELMAAKRLEVGGEIFTALRFPPLLGL
jgi:hypothetical protein